MCYNTINLGDTMAKEKIRYKYHRMLKAHNIKSFDNVYSEERYQLKIKKNKPKNKYFDHYEFISALNLREQSIELSLNKFRDYLEKFPYDYSASAYFITTLITAKNLQEAELELKKLEEEIKIEYDRLIAAADIEKINKSIAFCKLKLLMYQEKYSKAYNYLLDNLEIFDTDPRYLEAVRVFSEKQMDYFDMESISDFDYYAIKQLLNYSQEELLEHIKPHLSTLDESEKDKAVFNNNFPVDRVIETIMEECPNEKRVYSGLYEDAYVFRYDLCGKIGKMNTDFFKVFTFHDSSEIINMLPCQQGEYFDYYDLNYLKEENDKVKVKSGLDRFNKRYGKILDK